MLQTNGKIKSTSSSSVTPEFSCQPLTATCLLPCSSIRTSSARTRHRRQSGGTSLSHGPQRSFTAVEPTTTRATPASSSAATSSSVRTPPTDLDGHINTRNKLFKQRDLAFRRVFRARQIHQCSTCAPWRIILQTRQRVVSVVALLAVIALMQTDNRTVNKSNAGIIITSPGSFQQLRARGARALRVKLHAEEIVFLYGRRERLAVVH